MSHPDSSLPEAWIERIWQVMRATYGASFDRQWETPAGVDPAKHVGEMKAFWAHELRGFQQSHGAIKHALENLPDFPPNLVQFKAVCMKAPQFFPKALPAPKADPAVVAAVVAAIKPPAGRDPKFWAHALRADEKAGVKLTIAQRDMWRAALRHEGPA